MLFFYSAYWTEYVQEEKNTLRWEMIQLRLPCVSDLCNAFFDLDHKTRRQGLFAIANQRHIGIFAPPFVVDQILDFILSQPCVDNNNYVATRIRALCCERPKCWFTSTPSRRSGTSTETLLRGSTLIYCWQGDKAQILTGGLRVVLISGVLLYTKQEMKKRRRVCIIEEVKSCNGKPCEASL